MSDSQQSDALSVLVTGFEPFAGSLINPSQWIVDSLVKQANEQSDLGCDLHTALLPVDTKSVGPMVEGLWQACRPDVVLHFGESTKAEHLTLERVAVNLLDFDQPDNAGQRVVDTSIDPQGPAARFVTLPVRSLQEHLEKEGVVSCLSLSAGAYLCNQVLYLSLGHAERKGGCSVGFVHVPSLPEQVERGERTGPAMPRDQLLNEAKRLVRLVVDAYRHSSHG